MQAFTFHWNCFPLRNVAVYLTYRREGFGMIPHESLNLSSLTLLAFLPWKSLCLYMAIVYTTLHFYSCELDNEGVYHHRS